jgi:uncharacterized protein YidB (DUF937 family)
VIQDQPGGLSGLVQRFSQAGFGDQVKSWVSSGANLPISTDQLTSVLGQANIEAMSQQLGVSAQAVTSGLAALLPHLVDQLTPSGKVSDDQDLVGSLTALLHQHKA